MSKKTTFSEKRWPNTAEFTSLLNEWNDSGSAILLKLVWKGYDIFCREVLADIDCSQSDEDLERDITQHFEPRIHQAMTRYEPFYVQHCPYERETRKKSPAQPPEYDIAFVWRSNPRIMWPLEAKILRTDSALAEYVKEVKNNFLTCRYAPFSAEAGMIGYLLSGMPRKVFEKIARDLKCKLHDHPEFKEQNHKFSKHQRKVPRKKLYPRNFCCHHIILKVHN
ncbi:MAG: hypothetical protein ACYSWP_01520 [Planctomycetota bacterium]